MFWQFLNSSSLPGVLVQLSSACINHSTKKKKKKLITFKNTTFSPPFCPHPLSCYICLFVNPHSLLTATSTKPRILCCFNILTGSPHIHAFFFASKCCIYILLRGPAGSTHGSYLLTWACRRDALSGIFHGRILLPPSSIFKAWQTMCHRGGIYPWTLTIYLKLHPNVRIGSFHIKVVMSSKQQPRAVIQSDLD